MARLVHWEGTPELLKNMWKSTELGRLGRPITKIEITKPDESQKALEFNLPLTASLVVTFDVSSMRNGMKVTGTQSVTYPVGTKDGSVYILMPKSK